VRSLKTYEKIENFEYYYPEYNIHQLEYFYETRFRINYKKMIKNNSRGKTLSQLKNQLYENTKNLMNKISNPDQN
jgi:hypothetical protein